MGMSPFIRGLRAKVGHDLLHQVGVSAVVLNDRREVLLVRSRENDLWEPVGGLVEPGEEPANAAVREVLEEAGVHATTEHLVGVYDGPVVRYGNGDVIHFLTVVFRCRATAGDPVAADDETLDARYFRVSGLPPLRADHQRNINDALAGRVEAVFHGGRS